MPVSSPAAPGLTRTIRYEPRRVIEDVNVERISKTYSSKTSKVSFNQGLE